MITNRIKIKRILLAGVMLIMFLLTSGCEDVINVKLDNIEPRIVIEGYILEENPPYAAVIIHETADFYKLSNFTMVTGASVTISDAEGRIDTLDEFDDGVYLTPFINPAVGRIYTASVTTAEGVTYSATSTLQLPITIDSMVTEYQPGGGFGYDADEGYRLHVFFTDRDSINEYCNIKVQVNDSILTSYYLYDDQFSDGNIINYEYFGDVFQPGDIIYAATFAMDSTVFEYFSMLQNCIAYTDDNTVEGIPANPHSNWDNDALGYFGAFNVSYDQIRVPESDSLYTPAPPQRPGNFNPLPANSAISYDRLLEILERARNSGG